MQNRYEEQAMQKLVKTQTIENRFESYEGRKIACDYDSLRGG